VSESKAERGEGGVSEKNKRTGGRRGEPRSERGKEDEEGEPRSKREGRRKKKEGGGGKVEGGRLGSLTILPCPWSQWPTETTNLKREEGRPEPDQLPLQLKINDQLGVPKPIIDTRVI